MMMRLRYLYKVLSTRVPFLSSSYCFKCFWTTSRTTNNIVGEIRSLFSQWNRQTTTVHCPKHMISLDFFIKEFWLSDLSHSWTVVDPGFPRWGRGVKNTYSDKKVSNFTKKIFIVMTNYFYHWQLVVIKCQFLLVDQSKLKKTFQSVILCFRVYFHRSTD